MRTGMKIMMVCGELLLFGWLLSASIRAAEFEPAYLPASGTAATSPYSAERPTRITMTNKLGQVTTLEYRKPVRVVDADRDDALVPIPEFPALSSPARAEDLTPIADLKTVGYAHQANYQAVAPRVAQAPIVPVAGCAQGPVVQYPPHTTYSVPNYNAPVVGAPQTVYRPVVPAPAPVIQSNVQVGTGIYGQPVIYRPGQPLRNAWRWLTP